MTFPISLLISKWLLAFGRDVADKAQGFVSGDQLLEVGNAVEPKMATTNFRGFITGPRWALNSLEANC